MPELTTLRRVQSADAAALAALRSRDQGLRADQARIRCGLDEITELIKAQDGRLQELDQALRYASERQGSLDQEFAGLRSEVQARAAALDRRRDEITREARPAPPDPAAAANARAAHRAELHRDVLDPVFQLAGQDAVGSAVLVWEDEGEEGIFQFALTSWHVVRDLLEEQPEDAEPIVAGFLETEGGGERSVRCRLLVRNEEHDLALVRVEGAGRLDRCARIAPLARMDEIEPFSPIYTVGCPLGIAAQATRGEITRTGWTVGAEDLWMISSPAYFGNSGGGVFLEESRELIGIFAKIYTHGSYRPQVVTHMGLAVPLPVLHDWLEDAGFGFLLPPEPEAGGALAREAAGPPERAE